MNILKWLDLKGVSQRELGRRTGYDSNGVVARVIKQERSVPADDVPKWADALDLKGQERQQFIDECASECLPTWAWDRLKNAESALVDLRHELSKARSELSDIVAQLNDPKFKVVKTPKKRR